MPTQFGQFQPVKRRLTRFLTETPRRDGCPRDVIPCPVVTLRWKQWREWLCNSAPLNHCTAPLLDFHCPRYLRPHLPPTAPSAVNPPTSVNQLDTSGEASRSVQPPRPPAADRITPGSAMGIPSQPPRATPYLRPPYYPTQRGPTPPRPCCDCAVQPGSSLYISRELVDDTCNRNHNRNCNRNHHAAKTLAQKVPCWLPAVQEQEDQGKPHPVSVSCDEVHPRCGNCVKHGVLCDFGNPDVLEELVPSTSASQENGSVGAPTPTPTTASFNTPRTPPIQTSPGSVLTSTPTPSTPSTTLYIQPSPPLSISMSGQGDRMMELRLMHQYTTVTSKTLLINSPMTEDTWQRVVPQMAFSGAGKPYLADAILSVAALHLRSLNPNDRDVVRAAHAYSASTLAAYCASLNAGITPDNAEALFLTASLIAFQATASRIFIKDDADADADDSANRYTLPVAWFHAFQGVKTVVASSWMWIRNSTAVKHVIDSQPSFQLNLNPRSSHSFFGHLLDGLTEELEAEDPLYVSDTANAYSHAVCVINWAHTNFYSAASLAFPATVSRRFVDLVEAKRPRALSILACFFALLRRMDGVWWLQDVARREVMGLVSMFEPGSKWWRHLEWPIRIALWDGNTIPPDIWGAECNTEPDGQAGTVDTMMHHIELMADMLSQPPGLPAIQNADEPYLAPDSPD
ncbi:hypothetical protein G7046_g5225 [Stylonectria norvegica]|nr:hypothetical protein G7046_g5225 [Stylonectria norvegica]